MNPTISPTMKAIIREDDRLWREEKKRIHNPEPRRNERKPVSEALCRAEVERFLANGGTISRISEGGPLASKLTAQPPVKE